MSGEASGALGAGGPDGGSPGFIPACIEVVRPGTTPTRTALVVHGILGSASNWRSFVRRLVDDPRAGTWRWVLVDLRCHGESRGALPPHTVRACAEDLQRLEARLGVRFERAFGHSFGGKVVLELARHAWASATPPALREVWFLDTPLGASAPGSAARAEIGAVLRALRGLGDPLPARTEVASALRAAGLSDGIAQWMTTNVRGSAVDGYRWKFDLDGIEALIADYFALDLAPFVATAPAGLTLRTVRGGRSDRFGPADLAVLAALEAEQRIQSDVLPTAGHWLHVDDPLGLASLIQASSA